MANQLYPLGKKAILDADIDLLVDTIIAVLVDTAIYTFNTSHQFRSSITAGEVGTAQTLGTKTTTGGVFDAADAVWTALTGATVEAIVIVKDTGSAATSPLIAYIDTGTNLPVTPNGGNVTAQWNASGIFAI